MSHVPTVSLFVVSRRQRGCPVLAMLAVVLMSLLPGSSTRAQEAAPAKLAQRPVDSLEDRAAEGIEFDLPQHSAGSAARVVVLIPGLLAGGESLQAVRRELQASSIITATFRYSSKQGIQAAADLLSRELQQLSLANQRQQVTLVTHSMGGIVARAVIEEPQRFSANVTKLLMIAPPNHGSSLAELSTESLQQTLLADAAIPLETMRAVDQLIGMFFGQAKDELCPQSPLLTELNQRPRNQRVQYGIYSGTGGPLPREALSMSFLIGGMWIGNDPQRQQSLEQVRRLAMSPEWLRGSGDGVVSVDSTKLEGVKEFRSFAFAHNDFGAHQRRG